MAGEQLVPWIDSGDAEGNRNSMQNFEGDGIITSWDFNFAGGYIDVSHVKAYIYHSASGLTEAIDPIVLTGPNTIEVIPAVPDGDFLVVYRDTPKDQPLVDYSTGAVLSEDNLDKSNQQAVFATAEMADRFDAINASSADAIERSFTALTTANTALAQSSAAQTASTNAVNTANAANTTANNALQVAEDAVAASTGFQTNLEFYTGNDTTSRGADWQTGSVASPGIQRWFAGTDTASDFTIDRYNDAGVLQGSAVKVDRQTGNVTLENQLDMTSSKIVNLLDGTSAQDAATKAQLDAQMVTVDAQKIDKDGTLDFAAHQKLFNSSPTDPLHAASKGYVDQFGDRVWDVDVSSSTSTVIAGTFTRAQFWNPADKSCIMVAGGFSVSCDISVQGLNGRDQAGAFGAGWAHLYAVYNPTTSTIGAVASASNVLGDAGPTTMPAGYTHWAYLTPLRCVAGGTHNVFRTHGRTFRFRSTVATDLGSNNTQTFANLANSFLIPPNATQVEIRSHLVANFTSAGAVSAMARNSDDAGNGIQLDGGFAGASSWVDSWGTTRMYTSANIAIRSVVASGTVSSLSLTCFMAGADF